MHPDSQLQQNNNDRKGEMVHRINLNKSSFDPLHPVKQPKDAKIPGMRCSV